ncbi:alpha/beta hydrolase [Spirillospora sp. NPDC047279]|uniref:alpha/beta fold hydrolase n=1 Tax=Spirillospora sp. NPDC047279 TaxID=3155478 RepID=UPI0033C39476
MATFVLVPGFWLGAWAWDEVAASLRAAGHRVHAVTLTGVAERAAEATPEVDVDTHIADVIGVIEDNDLHEVVLVAHSGANMPVTGAADRVPGRLARIVYVDSGPLPSGMAQIDFTDPEEQAALRKQVEAEGDGWRLPVPRFDAEADAHMIAGLTAEHLAAFAERGTPEPFGAATQPLARPATPPATPKTAILSTFPLAAIEQMAASGNPAFSLMTGPEWSYRELPTGHWPMFSKPAELAGLLADIAG